MGYNVADKSRYEQSLVYTLPNGVTSLRFDGPQNPTTGAYPNDGLPSFVEYIDVNGNQALDTGDVKIEGFAAETVAPKCLGHTLPSEGYSCQTKVTATDVKQAGTFVSALFGKYQGVRTTLQCGETGTCSNDDLDSLRPWDPLAQLLPDADDPAVGNYVQNRYGVPQPKVVHVDLETAENK